MNTQIYERTSNRSPVSETYSDRGIDCVFLSCFDHEVLFFAGLLGHGGIRMHRADTLELADLLLLLTGATVFIVDQLFLDGSWQDALDMIRGQHALTATIVCADPLDQALVAAAPSQGAFKVLAKPMRLDLLRSSICSAHEITLERRLWHAARELQDRLDHNAALVSGPLK